MLEITLTTCLQKVDNLRKYLYIMDTGRRRRRGNEAEIMEKHPKYMEIVRWARAEIRSLAFSAGDRFYSEKELSGRFGLSRPTVRQALGVLEAEGYVERVRGSGTYVRYRGEAPGSRTMNIGIVSTYLDDYIFPGIIRGIEGVLTRQGYAIQFACTHNQIANEARALTGLTEKGVDGLIVEPTKSGLPNMNRELYRGIQAGGTPLVFFNAHYPDLAAPYVAIDDEMAGYLATRRLLDAGHRRIAGIFLLNDLQGHLRYLGYIKALAGAGIDPRDEWVLWYATEDLGDPARQPEIFLHRLEGCSAVFCYNDQIAIRLIRMLQGQGKAVPRDYSVVSVDNCDMSEMCDPPLTTIAHPIEELGRATAELMLSMIAGEPGESRLFPPRLVERKSVRDCTENPPGESAGRIRRENPPVVK